MLHIYYICTDMVSWKGKYLCILFSAVVLCVLCLTETAACAQGRHALVVGIGNYPENSGWSRISGDKDAGLVKSMLAHNGFPEQDIIVLKDADATKAAIREAFAELVVLLRKGDVVYVHFSGHGQQVTDIDGDEDDGLDEAFVPYDAAKSYERGAYEGENHIVDDELNKWLAILQKAVGNSGLVFVSMDSCHSGDVTRGEDVTEDLRMRGTGDVFEIPLPENRPSAKARHEENGGWVCLSACKSYQNNYEFRSEDGFCGRLTWALCRTLEQGITVSGLVDALRQEYEAMPVPLGLPQNLDAEVADKGSRRLF